MLKLLGSLVVAATAAAVGAEAYYRSPELRTMLVQHVRSWTGWTEAAREADPVGFVNHVEGRLAHDREALETTRQELQGQLVEVGRAAREEEAFAEHADTLVAEFRRVFRKAQQQDSFPVVVRDAAYTEAEVVSQVSLLLAQAEGHRQGAAKLHELRQQTEQRLEDLTVQIDETRRHQAAIAAQRGLLLARVLSDEGLKLVAQVEDLLDTNQRVGHANPVRSVQELLSADNDDSPGRPSLDAAREFLASASDVETQREPSVREPRTAKRTKAKAGKAKDSLPTAAEKPIYQQS